MTSNSKILTVAAAAVMSCGLASEVSASVLLPSQVTATASSEALSAENVVNLDGLSGPAGAEVHDTDIGGLWLTSSSDTTRQIKFEFDDTYTLDTMKVWNYNQSGNAIRGMRHTKIETSLDDAIWTEFDDDYEFAIGTGNANLPATDVIDMTGVTAKYVRFTALPITAGSDSGSWGDDDQVGLSEVQFIIVPEPASLVLLSLGSLMLIGRKR